MRSQLPSGISKIELQSRRDGRPVVRYDVLVPTGKVNGKRTHVRKRCTTEQEARKFLSDTQSEVRRGSFVHKQKTTVDDACRDWLDSKHGIKASTRRGYQVWLAPLRDELGRIELQKLSKSDLDKLVTRLRTGDVPKHGKWTARSVNGLLSILGALLEAELKQGHVVRNVAKLVDRIPGEKAEMKTLSEADMFKVLDADDRDRHLWWLALALGLRRGEIAGLRRKFVDLENRTLEVVETRVCVGKEIVTETPKSLRSRRVLPIPDEMVDVLRDAFGRVESDWVACGRDGEPYHPNYVTERWGQMLREQKIDYVRLHDARHTCASYLHYKGHPIADISLFLGHSTAGFTMNQYVHSKTDRLQALTSAFERP